MGNNTRTRNETFILPFALVPALHKEGAKISWINDDMAGTEIRLDSKTRGKTSLPRD